MHVQQEVQEQEQQYCLLGIIHAVAVFACYHTRLLFGSPIWSKEGNIPPEKGLDVDTGWNWSGRPGVLTRSPATGLQQPWRGVRGKQNIKAQDSPVSKGSIVPIPSTEAVHVHSPLLTSRIPYGIRFCCFSVMACFGASYFTVACPNSDSTLRRDHVNATAQ